ncbi:MAG: DUF58 domain-containing protein [Desulfobacteraceae bacterium]
MTDLIAHTFYRLVSKNTRLPVTLGLRNIYILPTKYGGLYLTIVVGMLLGSINYNNNLGFLLTFLLGSLGLTGMLHTYGMLYGLRIVSATAEPVFAGDPLQVEFTIADIKRERIGIRWYFNSEDQTKIDLRPNNVNKILVSMPTKRRGIIKLSFLRITCIYPLGLFRAWARINPCLQSLVYPHPISDTILGTSLPSLHGEGNLAITSGTDDFKGLSTYKAGDPPHRIHWQAYSRGQGLYTKTFAGQSSVGLMLKLKDIKGDDIEKKISVLCFKVLKLHAQQRHFGIQLTKQTIAMGKGRLQRDRCLQALALYESD